jgi:hypothetical protein
MLFAQPEKEESTDRIISICHIAQGGQGKYSSDWRLMLLQPFLPKNIAKGNTPYFMNNISDIEIKFYNKDFSYLCYKTFFFVTDDEAK